MSIVTGSEGPIGDQINHLHVFFCAYDWMLVASVGLHW